VFALTMRHLGHKTTNERKGTLYSTDNDPVDEHGNTLSQDELDSDDEYKETDTEAAEFILTELERSIRQSNLDSCQSG
jgi:hypothetical protein